MAEGVEYILSVDPGERAGWCLQEAMPEGDYRVIGVGAVDGSAVGEVDCVIGHCLRNLTGGEAGVVLVIEDQLRWGPADKMNAKSLRTLIYRMSIWKVLAHLHRIERVVLVTPSTWQGWAGATGKHDKRMAWVRTLARTHAFRATEMTEDACCAVVIGMWAARVVPGELSPGEPGEGGGR